MTLESLNALDLLAARAALERCCGARRWIDGMLARRPFAGESDLFGAALEIWERLGAEDWKEAFAHHPRIGDLSSLRDRWAGAEQAGSARASEETLLALKEGNDAYFDKFGFIFIVNASGKSAADMLEILRRRLPRPIGEEIKEAAEQHAAITRLRLEKMLREVPS